MSDCHTWYVSGEICHSVPSTLQGRNLWDVGGCVGDMNEVVPIYIVWINVGSVIMHDIYSKCCYFIQLGVLANCSQCWLNSAVWFHYTFLIPKYSNCSNCWTFTYFSQDIQPSGQTRINSQLQYWCKFPNDTYYIIHIYLMVKSTFQEF